MYPFIHIGRFSIGTFGIMLWLAAVCACWVLHLNFRRWKIDADAIGIVAISTVLGVIGAKLWHVLETPQLLMQDPAGLLLDRAGFAWFGGLLAAKAELREEVWSAMRAAMRAASIGAPACISSASTTQGSRNIRRECRIGAALSTPRCGFGGE